MFEGFKVHGQPLGEKLRAFTMGPKEDDVEAERGVADKEQETKSGPGVYSFSKIGGGFSGGF